MSDLAITARIAEIRSMLTTLAPQRPVSPMRTAGSSFASQLAGATGSYAGGDLAGLATSAAASVATPLTSMDARATASGSTASGGTAGAPAGDAVVADARSYLGVPYRWGGTDPSTGLDCSSLVQRVFGDLGVELPRTVSEQKDVGVAVATMAEAKPGDLLVFGDHHIGIYVGAGQMLHAPKSGDVVKIADVYATPSRIRRLTAGSSVPGAVAAVAAPARGAGAAAPYEGMFAEATTRYGLPQGLLRAVARTESGFDPDARSHAGALGLMQLMPGTARGLGVDPTDPAQAVDGAARLLRDHLRSFGSLDLALAAYNAGPGAVRKYDGIPPYRETQGYVRKVLTAMGQVAA